MSEQMNILNSCNVPKHIAFIMDGNGRWAKEQGKPRTYGHRVGSDTLKQVCKDAYELGVKYVTVYAFSTENWKRPDEEVDYLMKLLKQFLKESIRKSNSNNMKVTIIGDEKGLPEDIQARIIKLEKASALNKGLNLQIALNYGSKNEIIRAIKSAVTDFNERNQDINELTEEQFGDYLDTKKIPDPELIIRTSGEFRLSNFLMWQLAYSEFYFSEKYWPDFNRDELIRAILTYNKIERRFGGL